MIHFKTTDARYFRFDAFRREIIDYNGEDRNVVIPPEIDGMEVVSIGPDAFWNKGLTSVVLPPTLSVIGFYAFAFNHLKDVRIPESVALVEDGAFMHNKLKELRIGKNLFSIPHEAFRHNNLTRLILPENAQELQAESFSDNPITEIIFEGAPTFIHRHAFHLGTPEMAHVAIRGHLAKDLKTLLHHHAKHIDEYRALVARDK